MSNHLEGNFSLADQALRMLTIDWVHVSTPIQTLLHQLDRTWQEASLSEQRKTKFEASWKLCDVALKLLEEQRVSGTSPANLSYGEGVVYAYQGAIQWAQGSLEAAELFFHRTVEFFHDSNLGYFNASVIKMALVEILVQKSKEDGSTQTDSLEEALTMCQSALFDLDRSPGSSRQLAFRVRICRRFDEIVNDLCPGGTVDGRGDDTSDESPGPGGDGLVPDSSSPKEPDPMTGSEQQRDKQAEDSDKSGDQPERSESSLEMSLDFMRVHELDMAAGLPRVVDDRESSYPSIDSMIIDQERYYFRAVEPGSEHRDKVRLLSEGQYSIVKIRGESMSGLDIHTGDYVLLHKPKDVSFEPRHGQVVAAVVRDEEDRATLKRFLRYKDRFELVPDPENDDFPSFEFTDMDDVEIVGKAIAVLKKLDDQ